MDVAHNVDSPYHHLHDSACVVGIMKREMSGIDLMCVVDELQELKEAWVGKVYQHDNVVRIALSGKGRHNLLIEPGRRFHLTQYPKETRFPTSFAMQLRKHMQGMRLKGVKQHGIDRVVVVEIDGRELIAELFAKGNVVLREGDKVIASLRHRKSYEFPPHIDPRKIGFEEFCGLLSSGNVVKTLAVSLGLGRLYAQEVVSDSGGDSEFERLYESMKELFSRLERERNPQIVLEDGEYIDCVPIDLFVYENHDKIYFESMNKALDEFFRAIDEKKEIKSEEKSHFEIIIEKQKKILEEYEKRREEEHSKGDLLYTHYSEVQDIISKVKEIVERDSWEGASKAVKELPDVEKLDKARKVIVLRLDGKLVEVDVEEGIHASAQRYYNRAKKFLKKIEGAKRAIEEMEVVVEREKKRERKMTESEHEEFRVEDIPRKSAWYERFRWFISSDGFLVIGGRDADTNEEIYKRYMEKRDLVIHSQAHGGPLTLIKTEGKDVPQTTIHEACVFAVSYSSVWKAGQYEGECYLVKPEQVTKTPESGEYIRKGAFVIRGKREYFTVPVGVSIGIEKEPLRLIGGPPSAIEKRASVWVELEPGRFAHNDLAKKIYKKFVEIVGSRKIAKMVAPPEKIMSFLPPGTSSIKKEKF